VTRIQKAIRDLPGASVVLGKMVVNLLPEGAGDKGTALQRLVSLAGAERVLFIGDDVTDEAAFGARLDIPGVTVRVGRTTGSLAVHWLRRRADVDLLLDRLSRLREAANAAAVAGPRAEPGEDPEAELLGPVLALMKGLGPRGGRVGRRAVGTVEQAVRAALRSADPRDVAATRRVLELVASRLSARR
jgi:hypothetical protein